MHIQFKALLKTLPRSVVITSSLALLTTSVHTAYAESEYLSEVKLGVMRHDIRSGLRRYHEKGHNIIAEYIASKDYEFLYGLPHIGASVNYSGYTSSVYTGLTWKFFLTPLPMGNKLFLEASFGAALNKAERKIPKKRQAVGSNLLFRESLSLGYQINESHNLSVMLDHMSNASLVLPNPGITDFGIRYGISF